MENRLLKEGENDSVLVLSAEGILLEKSDAALRAGEVLGGSWRMLSLCTLSCAESHCRKLFVIGCMI